MMLRRKRGDVQHVRVFTRGGSSLGGEVRRQEVHPVGCRCCVGRTGTGGKSSAAGKPGRQSLYKGRSCSELKTRQHRVRVVELCAAGAFSKGLWVQQGTPSSGPCAVVCCGSSNTNPSAFLSPPAPWGHPDHRPGFPLRQGLHPRLPVCLAEAGGCRGSRSGPQVPLSIPGGMEGSLLHHQHL